MDDRNPVPGRVKNEREYLRFLVYAGELLASSLDFRETLMNVCAAAVDTVADFCFLVMPNDDDRLTTSHSTCFSSQSELICLDLDVRLVIIWATVGELRICCITGHR